VLAAFASASGRRTFGRRLLVTAPLVLMALAIRCCGHQNRELLPPALRVVSAIAWTSWLSTWLGPRDMRAALRSLGAPPALVELMTHTQRFATQLAATASEAWNAAALRAGLSSLRATARTVGHVAGVVVVRAFDRSERVAIASALRGGHAADDALIQEQPASQSLGSWP
jgi:hypothetical protein